MFANPTKVGISQRVVATLVASAMVLWSVGAYTYNAQAADLANISDTLTDSDPSAVSNHTIVFTIPTGSPGVGAGETITVDFNDGPFDTTGLDFEDVDFEINAGDQTLAAAPSGATWGAAFAGDILTLTSGTGVVAADDVVTIEIGTNATFGVAGAAQIVNPGTVASYEIVVTAGTQDTGRTRVAIVDNVLVSAQVDTVFDFTITGLATGTTAVNGTTTTGSTSPTAINFGNLVAGVVETLAQRLNVTTNARNGFVVTVESDSELDSGNGARIDNFTNGTDVSDTGTTWASPTNNIADDTTWGHWGITSTDSDLNSLGGFYTGEFGANEYIAVSSTTPREVFHHDGPSNGTTADIGSTTVGFQIEITPLQEAADDYNTTLTYIATPTF